MKLISFFLALCFFFTAKAQLTGGGFSFNCVRDTLIPCGTNCFTLTTKVPKIGATTDDYTVSKTACFKPEMLPGTAGGTTTSLDIDDHYSGAIPLPFTFPFYGNWYSSLVVGTNGTISFDLANAGGSAQWNINSNPPSTSYERALIMGPFHDIDISRPNSPNKRIKYEITGTKPHRKFIFSLYKVPCFDCNNKINNTSQITLYEGLGIVDVLMWEREICTSWNAGRALIGMQDYNRDRAIMAPGREYSSPNWGAVPMNEQWRFAPKVTDLPLLKKVELYKATGEFVATGDTVSDGNGNYTVSFNNVCPEAGVSQYIVQPVYYHTEYALSPAIWPSNDPDSLVYGKDTIDVVRSQEADPAQSVWTGAVDNSWENAANWACNNLPTDNSMVIINSGSVIINSNITVKKITVTPGANLTVNPGFDLTILSP